MIRPVDGAGKMNEHVANSSRGATDREASNLEVNCLKAAYIASGQMSFVYSSLIADAYTNDLQSKRFSQSANGCNENEIISSKT